MARIGSAEAGTRAFDVLSEHPGGLSRTMWKTHSSLSENELRRGIDWLRDLFGENKLFVKIRIAREWIYLIPASDRDWREDLLRHLKTEITRAKRHFNRCTDALERFPGRENEYQLEMARRMLFDLERAVEDLRGEERAA